MINKTHKNYFSSQSTLHETFQRICDKYPKSTALISNKERISYQKLDNLSDFLFNEIAQKNMISPGDYVAVILPRSVNLVVCLLSILKAGCVYCILDPTWPKQRIECIIGKLKTKLIIADRFIFNSLKLSPSWLFQNYIAKKFVKKRFIKIKSGDPYCIFFTSGTTGEPKGVLSTHQGTLRLFNHPEFELFSQKSITPLAAATPWDAFSLELWGSLVSGGTAFIIDEPYLSSHELRKGIQEQSVNQAWITSSLFNMIVEEDIEAFTGLKKVITGGEKLSVIHVKKFIKKFPNICIVNGYGPVESSIFATTHTIKLKDCDNANGIPIGKTVPGTEVYVIKGNLCQEGEIGEICIAGSGLATGYLKDKKLTDTKFVVQKIKGKTIRLYKTGDLGFFKAKILHFYGRADRQVKIRGNRVELTEVEKQIEKILPQIKSCRVIAVKEKTSINLAAFCITDDQNISASLAVLKNNLPGFQCPKWLVAVTKYPLTLHGKLDEGRLIENLSLVESSRQKKQQTNNNKFSQAIMSLLQNISNKPHISTDQTFADVGLSSLEIGKFCSRLSKILERPIPLSWPYKMPVIKDFIEQLKLRNSSAAPQTQQHKNESYPLSSMQKMYLMKNTFTPSDLTSHCLLTWSIKGNLNIEALQKSIEEVHKKHAVLNSKYHLEPQPCMKLSDIEAPKLKILSKSPEEKAIHELRAFLSQKLTLEEGEVWKTAIISTGNSEFLFGCVVHHIAFDGYSESVFASDISNFYNLIVTGKNFTNLSEITSLQKIEEYLSIPPQEKAFFEKLAKYPEINWPPISQKLSECLENCDITVNINKNHIKTIDNIAKSHQVSRFVILFYCWAKTLAKVIDQTKFCLGVPVNQRDNTSFNNSIGCYINMICVPVDKNMLSNSYGISKTSLTMQKCFEVQDIPIVDTLQVVKTKTSDRPPLFQSLFALQDNLIPSLKLRSLKTNFIRQPYLALPLELHAEVWPQENGELLLRIYHDPAKVNHSTAVNLGLCFQDNIEDLQPK